MIKDSCLCAGITCEYHGEISELVDLDRDGPAGDAGIKVGNPLLALDHRQVASITDLHCWLAELGPEAAMKLKILRRERV